MLLKLILPASKLDRSRGGKANGYTWTINVVADWILFDSATNSEIETVTFNKVLTIKAAAIPPQPFTKETNSLQQLIESIRAYGLEIINVEEFEG